MYDFHKHPIRSSIRGPRQMYSGQEQAFGMHTWHACWERSLDNTDIPLDDMIAAKSKKLGG